MKRRIRCGGKPMTAIVLAGGRGRRMKADKASLDIGGKTLLEHVLAQVEPLFDEILIVVSPGRTGSIEFGSGVKGGRMSRPNASTASPAGRVRVVEDERSGLGPLGGVLSGLRAARHEACAVIACDIPDIDIALLRSLAGVAGDVEIAVPVGPTGLYEPLFAVYRRPVVPEIESLLDRGERSVLPLYEACRTAIVRFKDAGRIRNLNTRADYEAYLRAQSPGRGAKL